MFKSVELTSYFYQHYSYFTLRLIATLSKGDNG